VRKILDVFGVNGVEQDLVESAQVMNALYTKYLAIVNQYQITSNISDLLITHIAIINTLYPLIITYSKLYIIMNYIVRRLVIYIL